MNVNTRRIKHVVWTAANIDSQNVYGDLPVAWYDIIIVMRRDNATMYGWTALQKTKRVSQGQQYWRRVVKLQTKRGLLLRLRLHIVW